MDKHNSVGQASGPKLGKRASEAIGKPGRAVEVTPGSAANGMGGGWSETRPGGQSKTMSKPESNDTGFAKPGGSQQSSLFECCGRNNGGMCRLC